MSELVKRLREYCAVTAVGVGQSDICCDAAREIERLEARVSELTGHLDWIGWGSDGVAADTERRHRVKAIIDERNRQDQKWGPQDHPLPTWLAILMEEVGELAAACLCHKFGNDDHPELDWQKEAIQVAAVALSMVEQYRERKR